MHSISDFHVKNKALNPKIFAAIHFSIEKADHRFTQNQKQIPFLHYHLIQSPQNQSFCFSSAHKPQQNPIHAKPEQYSRKLD